MGTGTPVVRRHGRTPRMSDGTMRTHGGRTESVMVASEMPVIAGTVIAVAPVVVTAGTVVRTMITIAPVVITAGTVIGTVVAITPIVVRLVIGTVVHAVVRLIVVAAGTVIYTLVAAGTIARAVGWTVVDTVVFISVIAVARSHLVSFVFFPIVRVSSLSIHLRNHHCQTYQGK